uniref:HECT and RLD domain containing E3 ubiquitin protein ligase 56.4 n=1 Tax=Lepisosteus oculatus TaxID=7918 RepID=W5MS74_LEPOC
MFCWGETTRRELGLEDSVLQVDGVNSDLHQMVPRKPKIADICAGNGVIAFIEHNGNGSVWIKGNGRNQARRRKTMSLVLKKEKIHLLDCRASQIVLVSETGKVFDVISEKYTVSRLLTSLNDRQIIQVACGNYHSLVLTKEGEVFYWREPQVEQCGSPKLLETLLGIPVAQIAAGGDHSFALSLSGTVFGWGRNSAGQLGLGDTQDRDIPTPVRSLAFKGTVFISCGEEHTAILTKGGLVFTFGSGSYGQLGHNSLRNELRPRLVAELWGKKVSQIACGRYHTLTYVSSSKTIYSFGCGEQRQLGNCGSRNQKVPLPVELRPETSSKIRIDRIVAGGNQSFVLCSPEHSANSTSWNDNKMILTVTDRVIEKWISRSDPKSWRNTKKEITRIFSSASCLNGSFLGERHYRTTKELSGLDLSLARLAFEKLATNDKVLAQVESVVLHKLIPSLCSNPDNVEMFRVYLILPELLRVLKTEQSRRDISVSLADRILGLVPSSCRLLEGLWSTLPLSFFQTLVKIFHTVSSRYLYKMRTDYSTDWSSLQKTVCVLQMLYKVCITHKTLLALYIEIQLPSILSSLWVAQWYSGKTCIQVNSKAGNRIQKVKNLFYFSSFQRNLVKLTAYPCIFDMKAKQFMFNLFDQQCFGSLKNLLFDHRNPIGGNNICVNRENLLSDTLQQLRSSSSNYYWPLKVKFKEEDGIDHGGPSQEFFSVIARELLLQEHGVFELFEDSRLMWFIQVETSSTDIFFLLGIICGMALYNQCVVNFHFPVALFKKLLGVRPTLEDLKDLSPIEARSLQELLDEDEDAVENLDLDFTVKGHEVVPHGREILVTRFNRQQYVDAYVDYVFNKSIQKPFQDFVRGFTTGCPNNMWKIFLPDELMAVLNGNVNYEWDELKKQNARYIEYQPTDQTIINFWVFFAELTEQQKKNFLSFMTGSDRLPVGGLSSMRFTIMDKKITNPDEYYPVANTCYGILYLPNYSSIDILRNKFLHAITFFEEFGTL